MTRDRTQLFRVLSEISHRHPQWRFGQLVSNLAGWADVAIWDVNDEQLLAAAEEYLRQSPDDQETRSGHVA